MEIDKIDHIYRDGRHYDRLFGEPNMSFWLGIAGTCGEPILELGCGTGKITIPIAEAGYGITGMDLSEAMLEHAWAKVQNRNLPVRFQLGDMAAFVHEQKFKTIILPSNNLAHLMDYREAEKCFNAVFDHLDNDGSFVIDAFVPALSMLTKSPEEVETLSEYEDPDGGGKIKVTATAIYEGDSQIRRVTTYHRKSDGGESKGHLNMRMYFPQELEALLDHCGFELVEKYGNYQKGDFSSKSIKQIIVAKKKGRTNKTSFTAAEDTPPTS